MNLPGYADLCEDSHEYILAAAAANLRGDPWQPSGEVLVRLAADVSTGIEKKLISRKQATSQKTQEWFQTQRPTLIFLGVKIALAARELWEPRQAGGLPIELTLQTIERVMPALIREYPGDAIAIQEWYRAYDRLVYVVGASVTTVLMLASALGGSTDDDVDRDGDEGSSEDEAGTETARAEEAEEVDEVGSDNVGADNDEDDSGEDEDDELGDDEDQDVDREDDDDVAEDSEGEGESGGYEDSDEEDSEDDDDESDQEEDDPEDEESDEDQDDDE